MAQRLEYLSGKDYNSFLKELRIETRNKAFNCFDDENYNSFLKELRIETFTAFPLYRFMYCIAIPFLRS